MKSPAHSPTNWVTRLFERSGIDVAALALSLPKEFESVVANPADASLDHALRLLTLCAEMSGEPNIGIRLAKTMDFREMGVYGYLLLNAQTLGQLLELAARYFGVLIRTSRIYFESETEKSRLEYRIISRTSEPVRHDVDWSFGTYICFVRSVLGDAWQPRSCSLVYPAPADAETHLAFYGPTVEFSAAANSFEIDNNLLDVLITDADPRLLELIRDHADLLAAQVRQNPDFLHHVRLLALQSIQQGGCTAGRIAAEVGMSISTFNRQLVRNGTNFRSIRDETIRTLACQALKHTDLSVGSIAEQLGYSEAAAFNHAFRRLEGMTPRAYRRNSGAP